jgi:hypothetical protein
MTKALSFLEAVSGFTVAGQPNGSADRPIRFAKVDPAYNPFSTWPAAPPPARVTFEGETTLSTKAYALADGVVPMPGRRVWLVPAGNSYFIGGTIGGQDSQGFWSDGTDAGVEFGGGSYYSTEDGLVIAGPVSFTEPPVVDGVSQGKGLIATTSSGSNSGNYTTSLTTVATLSNVNIEAGRAYEFKFGNGVQHTNAATFLDCRVHCTNMGVHVVEWYRMQIANAGQVWHAQGTMGYVRNTGVTDLVRSFTLQMSASAGTGYQAAGANRARFFEVWDVGPAADFTQATIIT